MFLRPFQVSKTQALWLAVMWLSFTIMMMLMNLGFCVGVFLLLTIIYGGLWAYKYDRDKRIIEGRSSTYSSHEEQPYPKLYSLNATYNPSQVPPKSSKGSNRLFVPPPLDPSH